MEGQPKVLITDEERAIGSSLKELQESIDFLGIHLLDAYHVLHNVRKRLKRKENVVLFSRILHSKNVS